MHVALAPKAEVMIEAALLKLDAWLCDLKDMRIGDGLTHGGDGGLIAIGSAGLPVMPFNSSGMYRGYVGPDGVVHTAIHREGFR